jgi:hypothetical protein
VTASPCASPGRSFDALLVVLGSSPVPVKKVIRAGEAFRIGSEKVRAGTYTGADTGCSGR